MIGCTLVVLLPIVSNSIKRRINSTMSLIETRFTRLDIIELTMTFLFPVNFSDMTESFNAPAYAAGTPT